MFGFIKNPIMIGSIVIIAMMSLTIWYLKSENDTLHKNIATVEANNQRLKDGIKEQIESLHRVEAARIQDQKISRELSKANRRYKVEADEMMQIFKNHNLSNLSLQKPKLIENRINKGTRRIGKQLEQVTQPLE